ncbi:MAG TPA: ATP-binding cassette domain-containing protein [Noviherbaspirillum sp.]
MTFALHGVSVRHPSSAAEHLAALSDLTIAIAQGEQVALIGPSGAGKTTLLHTLACAHRPDSGSQQLFGVDPWTLNDAARHALRARLFLAPQTPPLPPRQRVVNAVLAGRLPQWSVWQALLSLVRPLDPQAAYDALSRFHLQDKLYMRVDRLSGGERQRCGMARLLVSQAQAFLVDEPLSALDPALALQTLGVLQQESARRNATLICSLHQVELARAHFPRIVGVRAGRIAFDAPREAVTDAMIDSLYQHAERDAVPNPHWADAQLAPTVMTRCF